MFVQHHVERFGLFTIIVLGECINGVLHGFQEKHTPVGLSYLLGLLALLTAMSLQWIYFNVDGESRYCIGRSDAIISIFLILFCLCSTV